MTYIKVAQTSDANSANPQNMDAPGTWVQVASRTASKSGLAHISYIAVANEDAGNTLVFATARILIAGSVVATGGDSGMHNASGKNTNVAVHYQGTIVSGQAITVEIQGDNLVDIDSGTLLVSIGPG